MQNKKLKHRPSTKYPYFHKITGPTLFFSGEEIEKKKKKKKKNKQTNKKKKKKKKKRFSYLPTNFFSILAETQLFFTPYDEKDITNKIMYCC